MHYLMQNEIPRQDEVDPLLQAVQWFKSDLISYSVTFKDG